MELKNKCRLIPVEHACLVLAIVNAIGTGLALVGSIIMVFVFVVSIQNDTNYFNREGYIDQDYLPGAPVLSIFAGIFIVLLALAFLVSFIFSVLLCNGVYNRRPGHVKAYFVYGVVTTALAAQISATVLFDSGDPLPGLFGMFGCVIHSLFLVVVYQTYLKFGREVLFEKHVRLLES